MASLRLMENENCPMCSSCFGILLSFFRFERPASRSPVVTEQVQPSPNAHTSLHESLGVRNGAGAGGHGNYQAMGHGNYQAMGGTPTHRVSARSYCYTYMYTLVSCMKQL